MIERWSQGTADLGMAEEILLELTEQIRRHPWWQARAALVLALLGRLNIVPPARILDVGCGWGVTLEALEKSGYRTFGMDISRRTLESLDRPDRRLIEADVSQPLETVPLPFDAVLALDVLEHLDDDRTAVRRLEMLVRPGGVLMLSVPALPELFSEFDAIQGHRRRYLPETVQAVFAGSTLQLEQLLWWGRWLVPALKRQRSRPRARPGETPAQVYRHYLTLPPWPFSWLARLAFHYEEERTLRGSLKIGTSLFAVARRPEV